MSITAGVVAAGCGIAGFFIAERCLRDLPDALNEANHLGDWKRTAFKLAVFARVVLGLSVFVFSLCGITILGVGILYPVLGEGGLTVAVIALAVFGRDALQALGAPLIQIIHLNDLDRLNW